MTELIEPHAIGQDHARRDGERKVRGTATYAYETPVDRPAYAFIVQAAVARGRVTAADTAAAEGLAGVLAVLTADNAERLPEPTTASWPSCSRPRSPSVGSRSGLSSPRPRRQPGTAPSWSG